MRFRLMAAIGWAWCTAVQAQSFIPEGEALDPPTPARIEAICAAARQDGWAAQAPAIHALAQRAYEHDRLFAAAAWLHVYDWVALFGEKETDFVGGWVRAVMAAGVAHRNMAANYTAEARPLGDWLSPACRIWLLAHGDFSSEFFALLQPVDYLPKVLGILNELHGSDPAQFATYANLALAIAVDYDVPPPPDWPHAQVPAAVLPRRWPDPLVAFKWWTREDREGRTYQRLATLGADELKFVVDASATFDDLAWSQQVANYPLNRLDHVYTMIAYRRDRAAHNIGMWPEPSYSLPAILGAGGICIDQAYFATQAGKARGVPTLLFSGVGNDGRHAWFGYLDGNGKWQLDAGRYGEQRFVTGYARDPQTWRVISDHELKFLGERFHALPSFKESRVHAEFAANYLAGGDAADAERAARKAVNYEPRNQNAWDTRLAAAAALGRDAKAREGLLYEAMHAFQRYPDLELHYSRLLCDSLRARGQISEADHEERRIARKYRGDRDDLSLQQARDLLLRSIRTQSLHDQIQAYNAAVDEFGRGAGIVFFDQVVVVFCEHLLDAGERDDAREAVARARRMLRVEPGSQLAQEFAQLGAMIDSRH